MTEKLKNFPFILVFFAFAGYLGFQFYNFNYASDGEVEMHKTRMANSQGEIEGLKKKLVEGKKFMSSLEVKKVELQTQVKKLSGYQGALSEAPDVPSLLKLILTEAKKLDMRVDHLEPGKKNQKQYYSEQEFKLEIRGTFQQILLFAARIAQLQRILRIEGYEMKNMSGTRDSSLKGNILSATLSIRAYQYTLSKEDQIAKGANLK